MPENTVYVGRPTQWGNWFSEWNSTVIDGTRIIPETREDVIDAFRKYQLPSMDLEPLRGKDLACWCKPGELCHADVIIEALNG